MKNSLILRRRGFTFIELIIVTAIVAMLAAILFPAFNRVRQNARNVTCQSNLKLLGLGTAHYLQDYNGRYMPGCGRVMATPNDSAGQVPAWSYSSTGPWWMDRVLPYVKNRQVLICPSANGLVTDGLITPRDFRGADGADGSLWIGYGYNNDYIGGCHQFTNTPLDQVALKSDIADPAQTIVMLDSRGSNGGNYPSSLAYSIRYLSPSMVDTNEDFLPGKRHLNGVYGIYALYADGHVKWDKKEYYLTTELFDRL